MRDSNHRLVTLNRPVVTITATVYDRRALDLNSDIPLINSLNHLTYLTSNSAKVRETVANDGALERLVTILHNCHLDLKTCIDVSLPKYIVLKSPDRIHMEKRLALCAWKWTLAFQCLVLTGTRGTELIRKKLVSAGMLPLVATVLDNYLLYHCNYDHVNEEYLKFDLKAIGSKDMYLLLAKDQSYEKYVQFLVGDDPLHLSSDLNNDYYCESDKNRMVEPCDFASIWSMPNILDDSNTMQDATTEIENCFTEKVSERPKIVTPREFFLGRVIPKLDDIIWSLQLLAFISKYAYMKELLQSVELIKTLSFRSILERARDKMDELDTKRTASSNEQSSASEQKRFDTSDYLEESAFTNESSASNTRTAPIDDHFLQELQDLTAKCNMANQNQNSLNGCYILSEDNNTQDRSLSTTLNDSMMDERKFISNFHMVWDYNKMSKELDGNTWDFINDRKSLNLFPLVEKFTVSTENPHDVIYWSSVIMRNSCRKNEITGVRQCANFACGKWEEYPRQFAKCRRCKRTKYCSRKCQLKAWTYHRYWCQEVSCSSKSTSNNTSAITPSRSGNLSAAVTASTTIGANPTVNISTTGNTEGENTTTTTTTNVNEEVDRGDTHEAESIDVGSLED
ncbi:MYND-type zinc finger protein MUB1 KNAG_0E02420 [Huiozyma naganishii CBS 8797]|uniref:MYND-type domain-containing protein n=1 Tax=Huiozyma naganishii (strain ATCC MYA-139 / BCRC 22969 / CBS 8797 / KCTC 17520 / NBRC 10181 / NCYC 3082 / Yp74L-3) TaxID=1071383 RepID=J7RLU5_HUIN7|nr:hypothetical protein KNAG_0E02420 [Kazachstania naganishii CBS 8797]CCK70503.1 hypothetical protein KNAG_0E02420 [Kazachstania naganishii CBS 8797]